MNMNICSIKITLKLCFYMKRLKICHIYMTWGGGKHWWYSRKEFIKKKDHANNKDPNQTAPIEQSDLGSYCLLCGDLQKQQTPMVVKLLTLC